MRAIVESLAAVVVLVRQVRTRRFLCVLVVGIAPLASDLLAQDSTSTSIRQSIRWRSSAEAEFSYGHLIATSDSVLWIVPRAAAETINVKRRTVLQMQVLQPSRGRSVPDAKM
jgi:hypothetical protein